MSSHHKLVPTAHHIDHERQSELCTDFASIFFLFEAGAEQC